MTVNTMNNISGVFRITPLSPLHIGSGQTLTPMDYEIQKGTFIVKDVLGFINAQQENPAYALQVIKDGRPLPAGFVRYTLRCFNEGDARSQARFEPHRWGPPRDTRSDRSGEVREFIKDPFGRPFIPGSSLKGCLRTALAFALAREMKKENGFRQQWQNMLQDNRIKKEKAFERVGALLFCGDNQGDAKADVLKTLLVRDSQALDFEACGAMCYARVMNAVGREQFKEKDNMPIRLEAILPETGPINLPFTINRRLIALDSAQAKDSLLRNAGNGKTVTLLSDPEKLEATLRDFSAALLEHERSFYDRFKQDAAFGLRFIQTLQKGQKESNAIYLDLGYGAGWHAKTIGMALNNQEVDDIRRKFRLGKDAPLFPKTRKWAKTATGYLPMGWIKLEIVWE